MDFSHQPHRSLAANSQILLSPARQTNYNDGLLIFGAWEVVLPGGFSAVTDTFVNKAETVDVNGFGSTATDVSEGENSVGATTSLLSMTYANAKAGLGF